jgi:protein-tyrosine phosphatase
MSQQRSSFAGMQPIDATELMPDLYQGCAPPRGPTLAAWGFDAVVLCAREYQPTAEEFPGLHVIRARLDDSGAPMANREWEAAVSAASQVVNIYLKGGRVLVTCAMGRNRSGLVAGLVMHMLTGLSGAQIVRQIRLRRSGALSNEWFVGALNRLPARRKRLRRASEEEVW